MSTLKWMSRAGDESLEWDPDDGASIKAAKKKFKELQGKGYVAYRVVRETIKNQGEQIKHFDPNAGEILMTAPLAGG